MTETARTIAFIGASSDLGRAAADQVAEDGHPRRRPGAQRPLEGVGERVLGERDVPGRRRQQRHEPATGVPRDVLGDSAGLVPGHLTGCSPCHAPST